VSANPPRAGFAPGRYPIDGYGAQGFRFAGMAHPGSILALPSGIHAWPVASIEELTSDSFAPVLAESEQIEIVVIGTGRNAALPLQPFLDTLRGAGLRPEMMDTPAAIRTFNMLLAENRRVAAALLQIR
jgi:uncharacterized protein